MNNGPEGHGPATAVTEASREPLERRLLALDALSKLARQFSTKPDFEHLMSVLLMTLCGQFSVGDAVAILKRPRSGPCGQSFFATGRFRNRSGLAELDISSESCSALMGGQSSCKLKDMDLSDRHSGIVPVLRKHGVSLVCPLIHDNGLLGIIGIGDRVTGNEFNKEDVELIVAVVDTITPFLANTYLFWEIGRLNTWYLDILNSVKQGVFVFDSANKLKKINAAGLSIYRTFVQGISDAGEICGRPIEQVFPPHAFGGLVHDVMTSKIAGGGAAVTNFVARGKNAKHVYNLRLSESSEGDADGTDLILTLDEITAEREAAERLFNLQQLADRGVMASAISHELRNYLGLLLGGLELTQVAMTKGEGDKADEHIDKLKATIGNLEKFASGLMDYTKFEVDKQTSSLNGVISDVISFVSGQQRFKEITIKADLDRNLPEVLIDPDKIAQLLLNLLHNGADAIQETGRSDGEIMVGTFSDESEVVLIVSDNGAGVSPDIKDSLFKKRLTTKEHGHGYGLVTCAGIIEGHNATVTVDSEPDEGTVFTVRFPV